MRHILLAILLAALPAAANELVRFKVRGDVTQPYYLQDRGETKPAYAFILMPGGNGIVGYRELGDGKAVAAGSVAVNFLVRYGELFAGDGFVAAVMDVPSDRSGGLMYGNFRSASEHAGDIAAIGDDLRKRYPGVKVILVGHSTGSMSAAYAGRTLGNKADGVVLASGVFRPTFGLPALNDFAFREIASPVLFVNHADDGCGFTKYADARLVAAGFPMITVKGGDIGPPGANPCDSTSRPGFPGRENDVATAIRNWAPGKPYPETVA